ncbi:glycosyltransferase family 4 protein [Haladaptatus sp. DYSN1]|uniref:glycosyltransferase family 4 protein n=1 Tax=unclassified Haladaptatus TaxID=2622732 RepID=UPI002405BF19|nr:glycosyltransferase family 4 protein [Haladaptatus sp. DYSN1]
MKILRVAQKLYPDVVGGGPYHVHAMSRDQAEMGHDVTVVTIRQDPTLPKREEKDGYTIRRVDPTVELLGNTVSSGVAQILYKADDFDVVHAHSHLYFSTNLAALNRAMDETPLAITNHGLYSQNAPEWLFDGYLHTIGRWTFNQADVVFCYTEEDKERVRRFGVDTDIAVVSNGIDQERFTPEGPTSDLVSTERTVVLFVGRLVEGKRPQDALDAIARLREDGADVELYFCGEGPLRESLERRAAEIGISDAVTFLGHVPYDEMPQIYRSADILLLTSRAEGLPRTVLESLASGVPVVVSNLEQVAPVIEGGGETVPVGDVAGFSAALERVLEREYNPEKLLDKGLSWEDTTSQTTSVLEALSDKDNTITEK